MHFKQAIFYLSKSLNFILIKCLKIISFVNVLEVPTQNVRLSKVSAIDYASMTFRRKPFRRMRLSVESDMTWNATVRRIFVERQLVEWTSVEISSKFGQKRDNAKMKATYQNSAMGMSLELTGVIVSTTDKMRCYGSQKKGKELNRTI